MLTPLVRIADDLTICGNDAGKIVLVRDELLTGMPTDTNVIYVCGQSPIRLWSKTHAEIVDVQPQTYVVALPSRYVVVWACYCDPARTWVVWERDDKLYLEVTKGMV